MHARHQIPRSTRSPVHHTLLLGFAMLMLALPSSAWSIDHFNEPHDIGLNKVPNKGTSNILVIPTTVGAPINEARMERLRTFFASEGGPGSFREYWQALSIGAYDPIPTFTEQVTFDSCPIEGLSIETCTFDFTNISLITEGKIADMMELLLTTVRDEQGINLADFDINGPNCENDMECPDGHFDGVILYTDVASGVAFPNAALGNLVRVNTKPAGADASVIDRELEMGVVALMPPALHEFGHILGFVDLYPGANDPLGGDRVNDLMGERPNDEVRGISAFSRTQIGWGMEDVVEEPGIIQLEPVYDSGRVLRIGSGPRYLLIENRSGAIHEAIEGTPRGLNIYSVDEDALPEGETGFLDISFNGADIYLPNDSSPYLNISMPLGCSTTGNRAAEPCVLGTRGSTRDLIHSHATSADPGFDNRGSTGWYVEIEEVAADGTMQLHFREGVAPDTNLENNANYNGDEESDTNDSGDTHDADDDVNNEGSDLLEEEQSSCACSGNEMQSLLALMALAFLMHHRRKVSIHSS